MRDFFFSYLACQPIHDLVIFISFDIPLKKAAIPQLPLLTPAEFLIFILWVFMQKAQELIGAGFFVSLPEIPTYACHHEKF